MSTFHERKAERSEHFRRFVHGWKLEKCGACNGSGHYDNNGSPPCGCCGGTGKERVRPTAEQKESLVTAMKESK